MSSVPAGWYKDPADTSTQRYWDGEGWLGKAIPADVVPPDGPPAAEPEPPTPDPAPAPIPAAPQSVPPLPPQTAGPSVPPPPPGWTPQAPPPPGWMPQPPPPPGWQPPPGMQPPPGWQPVQAQPYPYPYPYPMPVPEVRPHGMALAGLGKRLTARLIDIFAVLILNIVVNGYFGYLYLQDFRPGFRKYMEEVAAGNTAPILPVTERMQTLSIAMIMIATLVWLAYEAPAIASSGQTLGKRILGIKVVPVEKNEPLGFARAFARWGRLAVWNLFWWCGVGLIVQFVFALSPAFDPRLRQAWHDKAAATVVVDVPPGGAPPSTPSGGSR
jgi:uncharacterized RDD family membrane protein YckC